MLSSVRILGDFSCMPSGTVAKMSWAKKYRTISSFRLKHS